jgi:hypothetical protein
MTVARNIADLLRQRRDLVGVHAFTFNQALTWRDLNHPFDPNHDPYIGYLPGAGFQFFMFSPAR